MTDADAGSRIVTASWASVAVFTVTAVPAALGVSALNPVALGIAVTLFVLGIAVWLWAFAVAVVRSASGDDIVVGSLFLLQGSPPRAVRRSLYLALGASVVIAGAPNVGKSSLVNALAGYTRSVVAPTSGTTRDVTTTSRRAARSGQAARRSARSCS